MDDSSAAEWLEDIILDELARIIADIDKKAGRTRDPASLELCKQFVRLAFGQPNERRAREVKQLGEAHARAIAHELFRTRISIHLPN